MLEGSFSWCNNPIPEIFVVYMCFQEVLKHEDATHCPRSQDYSSKWHSRYSHVDVGQNFEATGEKETTDWKDRAR